MNACTHPDWDPMSEISEKFQFPIGFFLHGTVDVSIYLCTPAVLLGRFGLRFSKNIFFLPQNSPGQPWTAPDTSKKASNLAM